MGKPICFVILVVGFVSTLAAPTSNDDDVKVPVEKNPNSKPRRTSAILKEIAKDIEKREAYFPHDDTFQTYLNAFALGFMAQAYGLNPNMLHGYNGAFFYPPFATLNPYPYPYPNPVALPPFTPHIGAMKRTFIPQIPGTFPHMNYMHHPSLHNIFESSPSKKHEEPPIPVNAGHFVHNGNTEKKKYVEKLLHTPLKELSKKHKIAVASKKKLRDSEEAPKENNIDSLISELGEFNRTFTTEKRSEEKFPDKKAIHIEIDRLGADDINEASLMSDSDGSSILRYLVHTKPQGALYAQNAHKEVRRDNTKQKEEGKRSSVNALVEAMKQKVKFEKDLLRTFVNYVCDKDCGD